MDCSYIWTLIIFSVMWDYYKLICHNYYYMRWWTWCMYSENYYNSTWSLSIVFIYIYLVFSIWCFMTIHRFQKGLANLPKVCFSIFKIFNYYLFKNSQFQFMFLKWYFCHYPEVWDVTNPAHSIISITQKKNDWYNCSTTSYFKNFTKEPFKTRFRIFKKNPKYFNDPAQIIYMVNDTNDP